jgi:hypothetical protein
LCLIVFQIFLNLFLRKYFKKSYYSVIFMLLLLKLFIRSIKCIKKGNFYEERLKYILIFFIHKYFIDY